MDYKALMDAKKAEDAIKESKLSLTKKIKNALELIRAFEPIGVYISNDPHQVEVLMEDLKKILEE